MGENVFFTGSAGTGKSVLLREIIAWCRDRYGYERVAVTASTGIAAINIGGCTLHSWAKIKLGREPAHVLVKKILDYDERIQSKAKDVWAGLGRRKPDFHDFVERYRQHPSNAAYRWEACTVLIIDESKRGRSITVREKS